jgi:Ca2+-binding EF-hand superfamily protein
MKKLLVPLMLVATPFVTLAEATTDFHPLDANQDGFISLEEAKTDSALSEKFFLLDFNGDGLLSTEELAASDTIQPEEESEE